MDETILIKVEIEGQQAQKDLTASLDKQSESIARLREENKKLTKERNEVNFNSAEGKKKLEELNAQLDQNNKKIKENVDAYTKQKINIGNYKSALDGMKSSMDKVSGGLVTTAENVTKLTSGMNAFVAIPAVAVAVALGAALGALTAYFKGSEEGQDRLSKVMAIGKAVFEGVIQVVEKLGEVVFDTLEFLGSGLKAFISFFSPAVGAMLEEAIAKGEQIASMQDAVDARENELIVKRAETNKKVAELRRTAIGLEGEAKRKVIEEAIALEEELSRVETEQAAARLAAYEKEIEGKGLKTEEEKQKIAELTAARINAEAQAAEATLRFQKELEKLNDEERAKQAIIDEEMANMLQRSKDFEREMFTQTEEVKRLEIEKTTQATLAAGLKLEGARVASILKGIELEKQAAAIKKKIDDLEAANKLATISSTLGQAAALFAKDSVAYKFIGVARATVDTYRAANLALASYPPPFGAIAAGVAIATGLANVTKILDIGFAEGGYTGDGGKHDVAGVVHRGEYVVPKHIVQNPVYSGYISTLESARQRGYADGGFATNSATAQIEQQAMMAKAFEGAQFWVSWTEGQQMGKSVEFKERLVTI